jgi:hypothetical protein
VGDLEHLVLSLGRERHDQVEAQVVQIVDRHRHVAGDVDAHLLHHGDGEGIGLAGPDAGGLHIDAVSSKVLEERRGHGRTDSVAATGEENRAWQIAVCPHRLLALPV